MEELKKILAEYDLPRRARACYQCGACAGGCPVGQLNWDFNPRRIIEMIVQGELEALLASETIWLCSTCLTCMERCSQKIQVAEIIGQLKNAAARQGIVPQGQVKKCDQIMAQGWAEKPIKRTIKNRQSLGLPELSQDIGPAELQALAKRLDWPDKSAAFKAGPGLSTADRQGQEE